MEIVELYRHDITQLAELQPEGWNDIIPNFNYYVNSSFCYTIKAVLNKKLVGIGATIIHQDVAWLAHIIVLPQYRNKGIGQAITQSLMDSLVSKKCETIYLIATELGAPVYEKIGFQTETEYIFFENSKNENSGEISNNISFLTSDLHNQVAHIDKHVSGENRMVHLEEHLHEAYVYTKNKVVEGYYLPSFGEGLIIANSSLAGIELMKLRMNAHNNVAFPVDNLAATSFMNQNSYKPTKKAKRMRFGKKRALNLADIYSRIGGNFG